MVESAELGVSCGAAKRGNDRAFSIRRLNYRQFGFSGWTVNNSVLTRSFEGDYCEVACEC